MVNKEEVIKTDVDKLLKLLREKKVITMIDLSKEMNLPFKTMESLTGLLEEEKMLHITYKFTTPYVNYGPPKVKGQEAKEKTAGEKALFAMEQEDDSPGEFTPEDATITEKDKSTIKKDGKEDAAGKKGAAGKEAAVGKEGATPGAKEGEKKAPAEKLDLIITDNIEELIAKANELIQKGDLEGAREIFLTIKRKKSDLPKEFMEKEKRLKEHLLKLNEVLILGMDKAMTSEFTKKYEEIQQAFNNIQQYIKDNKISSKEDLQNVEKLYATAKNIYLAMPEGFVERRVEIQDRLLDLYKTIISNKKTLLTAEFHQSADKITSMLKSITDLIGNSKLEEAGKILNEVNKLYITMPGGFLKEKTELQNQILELYQKLILNKESTYAAQVQEKSVEIDSLITQAMEAVNNDDMDAVKTLYVKITDTYSGMPKGFLETKAELESKMIDLYHLVSLKLNKTRMEEVQTKIGKVKELMKAAGEYITNKEYDLAKEAYMEITLLYNTIPKGYSELPQLRVDILNLYKAIMPTLIEAPPTDADAASLKKYNGMLKLLVQIHEDIKNQSFETIKPKYLMAYKLYHEMPIGFLEGRTNVYDQISKVYHELKLYNEVNRLPELANAENFDELKASLDYINGSYSELVKQYPEDMELFDYVKKKYLIYLNLLNQNFGQTTESGKEVRERIEDLSQKETIEGETLAENLDVQEPETGDTLSGIPEAAIPSNIHDEQDTIGDIPDVTVEAKPAEAKQG